MVRSVKQWRFNEGDQIISSVEHKLGKVVGFVPDMLELTQFVVVRGLLFKHDYHVPVSAVTNDAGDTLQLAVAKQVALSSEWDVPLLMSDRESPSRGSLIGGFTGFLGVCSGE